MEKEDLYRLNDQFLAENLSIKFEAAWRGEVDKSKADPNFKPSLRRAIWKIFGKRFSYMALPKALSDACALASPTFAKFIIQYVQTKNTPLAEPVWHGYARFLWEIPFLFYNDL